MIDQDAGEKDRVIKRRLTVQEVEDEDGNVNHDNEGKRILRTM